MIADLINAYSKYKLRTLAEYVNLISQIISVDHKKILRNKKRAAEIMSDIIDIYITRYLFAELKFDISKIFIESPYIDEYKLTKEINAIYDYFMKHNMVFDLAKNEQEIILMAVYLQMALKLDELTCKINESSINYNNQVYEYIDDYHKINFIFLIDSGKKNVKKLIESIKKSASKEKEIYESLSDKNSFNKYIKINNEKDLYITQYNYYIEELEKYDSEQSQKIYFQKNIDDNFTIISAQLAVSTLLKELQAKRNLSTFLIPIKKKFLNKEKNIKEYKKLLESKITSKYIKLLIDNNEATADLIEQLNNYELDYYIYCNKETIIEKIDQNIKYIFSKEFMKNNQIIVTKQDNIILETMNDFIEDEELVYGNEKENK
ncbi:MAG: hypothetical protein GX265_04715 [Mollicutes bacterium]|nr:hypothetical protein [Mollicutes bacterium]